MSVNNVETLVLGDWLGEPEGLGVNGFINVAPGMTDAHGWPVQRHRHRTTGPVDTIYFSGTAGLIDLLQMPGVVEAARRTALGLMRKGQGMMARYHDDSLADDVFSMVPWADPAAGVVFCFSEAPTAGAVQRIHERAGHPADAVYEVSVKA
ncbi:MAG: nickel-binding protein [Dermatophilaceae bacterium]